LQLPNQIRALHRAYYTHIAANGKRLLRGARDFPELSVWP
jgi:hypothetical protein